MRSRGRQRRSDHQHFAGGVGQAQRTAGIRREPVRKPSGRRSGFYLRATIAFLKRLAECEVEQDARALATDGQLVVHYGTRPPWPIPMRRPTPGAGMGSR